MGALRAVTTPWMGGPDRRGPATPALNSEGPVSAAAPGGVLTRRQALTAMGSGVLALAGCGHHGSATGPRGVAAEALAFNVQPLGGASQALQQQAIRALALRSIRVTLGLASDVAAAHPYVRSVPEALGLVADFNLGPIDPAQWPSLLDATLRRYPEVRWAELLNEPDHFNGLSPERYVQDFLRPGFALVRDRFPGTAVVAAAPVGTLTQAPDRFQRLTAAGADEVCDFRAIHVYFDDDRALAAIARATGRPILVTETGTNVASQHVRWYTEVIPRIRRALGAELIFWYDLLESADAYPGFSVIANTPDAAGQPQALPGSGLYPLLRSTATLTARPHR